MVSFTVPQALPRPQDIAVGVFLLTHPQILWYARFTEPDIADHM